MRTVALLVILHGCLSAARHGVLTAEHAVQAERLPWSHRAPFDRMLVAQAHVERCPLVTMDEHIRAFPRAPLHVWA
ncbi:PIN domain-containing protein [Deinococcus sonorensis]|uniref:PIN domain-containing protein n=2 Tax=Deinococcus sonorensis TaxID=309891 RepID=A0AAU7U4U7_9DEIO